MNKRLLATLLTVPMTPPSLFDNTKSVKRLADEMSLDPSWAIDNTPTEEYQFEVYQSIKSNPANSRWRNRTGFVLDRYMENGYCRYIIRWDDVKDSEHPRKKNGQWVLRNGGFADFERNKDLISNQ